MKAKVVSIVLVVLLVGLSGFSAIEIMILKNQVTAQTAQIAAKEAQITELKSEIEAKDKRISELEEENAKLQKEVNDLKELSKTAKIEISFRSNPVPCVNGEWHFRVIFTEVNGVGVYLNNLTLAKCRLPSGSPYNDPRNKHLCFKTVYDRSWIAEKWLGYPSAYFPPHYSADFGAGFPYFSDSKIDYVVITITGVDDNGNEITAIGRVDLLSP